MWFNDQETDDPAPASDPQSGDVTDGSVDYFDFDWGEMVVYDEATMEPVLFDCTSLCADTCHGSGTGASGSGTQARSDSACRGTNGCTVRPCGCDCGGSGSGNGCTDGAGDPTCVENQPAQQDEGLYVILPE